MRHLEGKVLVIADIHQNVAYANFVLTQDYDYVVFLGDYFDTFRAIDNVNILGMEKMCKWVNETAARLGDKAIWLVGNHDVAYFASFVPGSYQVRNAPNYCCSGWTRSKAKEFNKHIDPQWVANTKLCVKAGDYILSHAGFSYTHFIPFMSELDNVERLHDLWEEEKQSFFIKPRHWIWDVGILHCGNATVGSPVWLRWGSEFVPLDGIKQIVGHTCDDHPREMDGNFCIDCNQTVYGLIDKVFHVEQCG